MHDRLGTLTVYAGPMFAKKTTSVFMEVETALEENKHVVVYKPVIDTRKDEEDVVTHDGVSLYRRYGIKAMRVPLDYDFIPYGHDVVVIEEAQFFNDSIIDAVVRLMEHGVHVVVSGLDLDSNGQPFGAMPALMCLATHVQKLHGSCQNCKRPSTRTYRKPEAGSETVLVGAEEIYVPMCLDCWESRRL